MEHKLKSHPFLYAFAVFSLLALLAAGAVIGMFYYIFSIPKPEGFSLASWPQMFTDNFSAWMHYKDGTLKVEETGLGRLDAYGLWLQAIDESGQEIFSYQKPEQYPAGYTASALASLGTSPYADGNTVFVSSFLDAGGTCTYLVGFPYAIGKYMLYYDGEKLERLLPAAKALIRFALVSLAVLVFGYVFWLSRKLSDITDGIRRVSLRSFTPRKEKGICSDIYAALNKMDREIRESDRVKEETERGRREWIANITHDLKTPLSPIKGYAELLASNGAVQDGEARAYGEIILKNVAHVEKLVNDLKLAYQLASGALPYHPKKVRLTRYLKELAIDIINDPAFSGRNIGLESGGEELAAYLDPDLFRRAVQNIIINALIHNPPDTDVKISVHKTTGKNKNPYLGEHAPKDILLSIRDNGAGMDEAQQAGLFDRYYRGTNTKEKPEGSGLGLAIAKQVIVLHGGEVSVRSTPGVGTEFLIALPSQKQ